VSLINDISVNVNMDRHIWEVIIFQCPFHQQIVAGLGYGFTVVQSRLHPVGGQTLVSCKENLNCCLA